MKRLKHVDSFLPAATVSMEQLTDNERKAAAELADLMALPLGTLLRRAEAVRLASGHDTITNCLREATQHMIFRSVDSTPND